MENVRIRLYYDFASTLCYVSHRVLSAIEQEIRELGVELEWRPIDLTESVPWDRGDSFTAEVREAVRNTASELGIEVEMPDPWLDSRPASEVALAMSSPETEAQWRRAVFHSIFERGRYELGSELQQLAEQLTDPNPLDADGDFQRVENSTREAVALGVTGVPTMLLDNWLFGGIHDGETMLSILEQLAEQYRELGDSTVN